MPWSQFHRFIVANIYADQPHGRTVGRPKYCPTLRFTHELSSYFFYKSTVLSSLHQMAIKCIPEVRLGKASTIGIEISSIPPLIFTWGYKVRNLTSFSTSLANRSTLSLPCLKMHQDIRTLKQTSCVAMIARMKSTLSLCVSFSMQSANYN